MQRIFSIAEARFHIVPVSTDLEFYIHLIHLYIFFARLPQSHHQDAATWLPYLLAREGESLWFDDQAGCELSNNLVGECSEEAGEQVTNQLLNYRAVRWLSAVAAFPPDRPPAPGGIYGGRQVDLRSLMAETVSGFR